MAQYSETTQQSTSLYEFKTYFNNNISIIFQISNFSISSSSIIYSYFSAAFCFSLIFLISFVHAAERLVFRVSLFVCCQLHWFGPGPGTRKFAFGVLLSCRLSFFFLDLLFFFLFFFVASVLVFLLLLFLLSQFRFLFSSSLNGRGP
jgi:hypothetical protein